jgi:hypothetical protein
MGKNCTQLKCTGMQLITMTIPITVMVAIEEARFVEGAKELGLA